MFAFVPFQLLLNAIGWILAWIYGAVGSFGISIILLTILIRVVLLPLGIKQIKSMQAMQSIQPRVKELQKKYKGNKQKQQEETMKLYKDAGVNPLGGCLPVLLQFPLLVAMYAVIRPPILVPVASSNVEITGRQQAAYYIVHNSHIPEDSELYQDILTHQTGSFLGMNLQCSPIQAGGGDVATKDSQRKDLVGGLQIKTPGGADLPFQVTSGDGTISCGGSPLSRAPYYLFLLAMVLTTFYQQRQMQKASPPGAQTGQQQTLMKIMPIMFGVFGIQFAAGLLVYWTTANFWQIGQQYALLKLGHIGPDALDRRIAEQRARGDQPAKQGFMGKLMAQAEAQRAERDKQAGRTARQSPSKDGTTGKPKGGQTGRTPKSGGSTRTPTRRPNPGKTPPKPVTKKKPGDSK
ncbi:MAG: YidC/Oxa1 family rane protein insertase [Chloroflexota bacterium]|nr:YidC/Oxa1 family rane protein insertase [Chloroflexota bacterium]